MFAATWCRLSVDAFILIFNSSSSQLDFLIWFISLNIKKVVDGWGCSRKCSHSSMQFQVCCGTPPKFRKAD